eukprot:11098151-Alexandrium_andersonii.AAC.1
MSASLVGSEMCIRDSLLDPVRRNLYARASTKTRTYSAIEADCRSEDSAAMLQGGLPDLAVDQGVIQATISLPREVASSVASG